MGLADPGFRCLSDQIERVIPQQNSIAHEGIRCMDEAAHIIAVVGKAFGSSSGCDAPEILPGAEKHDRNADRDIARASKLEIRESNPSHCIEVLVPSYAGVAAGLNRSPAGDYTYGI